MTSLRTPAKLPYPWIDVPMQSWSAEDLKRAGLHFDSGEAAEFAGWRFIKSRESDVLVLLRLQMTTEEDHLSLNYVLYDLTFKAIPPYDIQGKDLRQFSVSAICSAYSKNDAAYLIGANRLFAIKKAPIEVQREFLVDDTPIFKELHDKELPKKYARNDWFYVLVAVQYEDIEHLGLSGNTAAEMAKINSGVAAGSVRRWIKKARDLGLLAPADWKRS